MNGPLVHLKFRFEFKSSEVCLLVSTACYLISRIEQKHFGHATILFTLLFTLLRGTDYN